MLGILRTTSIPKPLTHAAVSRLSSTTHPLGSTSCKQQQQRCHHSASCPISSSVVVASIWHAIFPSGAKYPSRGQFHEHRGEGSWNVVWDKRPARWLHTSDSAWLLFGVCTCCTLLSTANSFSFVDSSSHQPHTATDDSTQRTNNHDALSSAKYRIIGVPGDGRCLFRAVSYGARLKCGEQLLDEKDQIEVADELRAQVTEELLKRRKEMEWIIEGDFETYVNSIKRPNSWGGEPELLLASYVLRMPISVFMINKSSGDLVKISSYGQEYGNDVSHIHVLFHGYGHYDVLEILGDRT